MSLERPWARGRQGGRPRALDAKKQALLYKLYDETLYEHFKEAMSRLKPVAVDEWPRVETSKRPLIEVELADGA